MSKIKITPTKLIYLYENELNLILEECDSISVIDGEMVCSILSMALKKEDIIIDSKLLYEKYSNVVKSLNLTDEEWRQQYDVKKIINLLLKGTKNGAIIECDNHFIVGKKSRGYRLTENYRNKGIQKYEFKTTYAKNLLSKIYFNQLNEAFENPIAKNLIKLYSKIELNLR
jgi:hypothetical protein